MKEMTEYRKAAALAAMPQTAQDKLDLAEECWVLGCDERANQLVQEVLSTDFAGDALLLQAMMLSTRGGSRQEVQLLLRQAESKGNPIAKLYNCLTAEEVKADLLPDMAKEMPDWPLTQYCAVFTPFSQYIGAVPPDADEFEMMLRRAEADAAAAISARAEKEEAARRKQEEEAEAARRKQEEEAEAARRKQEEEAEAARRKQEEEAEAARRKQEEEAEAARRKQEEEAEAARRKQEEVTQAKELQAIQLEESGFIKKRSMYLSFGSWLFLYLQLAVVYWVWSGPYSNLYELTYTILFAYFWKFRWRFFERILPDRSSVSSQRYLDIQLQLKGVWVVVALAFQFYILNGGGMRLLGGSFLFWLSLYLIRRIFRKRLTQNAHQYYQELFNVRKCKAKLGSKEDRYELGKMYQLGLGVQVNVSEAAAWYRKSAEQEFDEAQFALGELYMAGEGVSKDASEAVEWYKKASDRGNANAQFRLAEMYRCGDVVPLSSETAVALYTKAASRGHILAQKSLGDIYCEGQNVPKNMAEAVRWYRESARGGNSESQKILKQMKEKW